MTIVFLVWLSALTLLLLIHFFLFYVVLEEFKKIYAALEPLESSLHDLEFESKNPPHIEEQHIEEIEKLQEHVGELAILLEEDHKLLHQLKGA